MAVRKIPDLPHPGSPLTEIVGKVYAMTRDWYFKLSDIVSVLQQRVPPVGTATFAAGTTVAVTLETPEQSADYTVLIEAVADRNYWPSSKTTTGFTINASASNSDTVGWVLFRR